MTDSPAALLDWLIAALLVGGAAFALVGSLGLVKLADFYRRLHGPTKATTLGVGAVLLASSLFFSQGEAAPSLRELLLILFLFATAPVSAQLLVKSALVDDPEAPRPPPDSQQAPDAPREASSGGADTSGKP